MYSLVKDVQDVKIDFIQLFNEQIMSVRDVWAYRDLGIYNGSFTASKLGLHQSMFLRLNTVSAK